MVGGLRCLALTGGLWLLGAMLVFTAEPDAPPAAPAESIEATENSTGPVLVVENGHTKPVVCAAFSADNRLVVTGSDDRSARIWEVESGELLQTLDGHDDTVVCAAFSPDGRRLLTAGYGKAVRLWDLTTGQTLQEFKEPRVVRWLGFSPHGQTFLTATDGRNARLWDAATSKQICRLAVPADVHAAIFSPDGQSVITATADAMFRLWDVKTGQQRREWFGQFKHCRSLAFSSDGRRLLCGSAEPVARLWDTDSGAEVRRWTWGKHSITHVGLSPDERTVYLADTDELAFGDAGTGQIVRHAKLLPHATDSLKRLLGPQSGFMMYQTKAGPGTAFSADGRWAVMWAWEKSAVLVDLDQGKVARRLDGAVRGGEKMYFAPDGRHLWSNSGLVWDLAAGCAGPRLPVSKKGRILAFVGDGRQIVIRGLQGVLRLWDIETNSLIRQFSGQKSIVLDCQVSPDGRWLATGSDDKKARLWDMKTGRLVKTCEHRRPVWCVHFSPDSRHLLTGCDDKTARLWCLDGEIAEVRQFKHTDSVWCVGFSADGRYALTTGGKTATLWDLETGREHRTFSGKGTTIRSAELSADGILLVTGDERGAVRLWDVSTGQMVQRLLGHRARIGSVCFSPDGRWIVSASYDNTARLWNVAAGQEMATLVAFRNGDWAVIDPQRRYDGSNAGDLKGLHWLVDGESISLEQLKENFYDPGLLAKITGFNAEKMLDVRAADKLPLFPEMQIVEPTADDPRILIHLRNRGGGIGRVVVRVNGKEILADARGPAVDPQAPQASLEVSLAGDRRILPGEENLIGVQVYNGNGLLRSRETPLRFHPAGRRESSPQQLWAIVAGCSQYNVPELKSLRLPAKDAEDFAAALTLAGGRLLGEQQVHVKTLTTRASDPDQRPTQDNLKRWFAELMEARSRNVAHSNDVLVVYLAGHGASRRVNDKDEFYYLTSDAVSREPAISNGEARGAISGANLRKWLEDVNLKRQVLVLDTCAAGQIINSFAAARDVPSSQKRALEQLKDAVGLYILAGCAADAKSYETIALGHGFLTHSLLLGMSGGALCDGDQVHVLPLFSFAINQVPQLAASGFLTQRPQMACPVQSGTLPIGRLTLKDRRKIPVQLQRPTVLRAVFLDADEAQDIWGLARAVNDELSSRSLRNGSPAFHDAEDMPGAYKLSGLYRQDASDVIVDVKLSRDEDPKVGFQVRGARDDLPDVAQKIIEEVERRIMPKH